MSAYTIKAGDVVIVPDGHGSASGKIGRVRKITDARCYIDVPVVTVGPLALYSSVRVELATLERAERMRIEAEQANIRS